MVNIPLAQTGSISSKSLVGTVVKNDQGEVLGVVEEILFGMDTGNITNLVLSRKGLLGKKRIAVPWEMFKLDDAGHYLRLNVDKEFLQQIPAYQGDK